MSTATHWTPERDRMLAEMNAAGATLMQMAVAVGLSDKTVRMRLRALSLRSAPIDKGAQPEHPDHCPNPQQAAWRRCLFLGCGRVFWSPHGGVRQCPQCRADQRDTHHATPV